MELFYSLCLISVAVVLGFGVLAARQPLGLRGLAFHPFNLLGFFVIVTVVDFAVAYETTRSGQAIRLGVYSEFAPSAVLQGMLFFCLCCLGLLCGLALSVSGGKSARPRPAIHYVAGKRAATLLFVVAVGLAAVAVVLVINAALSRGSLAYVAATRATFFRDNQILFIFYSMVVPAFFLFGSRMHHFKWVLLAFTVCVLMLLPIGSRGSLAIVTVGVMFWICRNIAIPIAALYITAPFVALSLTFYRWWVRESTVYGSFQQFLGAHGGLTGILFGTPEVSMAEAITINVTQPTLHRAPWESILGIILAPVPRAVVPDKPIGASSDFTQNADLSRWMMVKSEWTITGFSNLLADFGYIGALFVIALLAYWWGRVLVRASVDRESIAFAGPVLIYFMYVFYRADLYNLGLAMWPALLVSVGFLVLRSMLKGWPTRTVPRPSDKLALAGGFRATRCSPSDGVDL